MNYFDNYGVESGYNQTAPGRDIPPVQQPAQQQPQARQRGPQPVPSAVGPAPVAPVAPPPQAPPPPFRGAQQTIGATAQPASADPGGYQAPGAGIDELPGGTAQVPQSPPVATPSSPMDVYNQRLAAGHVSSDPTQRARELQDATNAMQPAAPAGPQVGAYRGALQGAFNMDKMNAAHAAKSPKYAFAMLAEHYPDTPEGLEAMAKDPRFAAAGLQLVNSKSGKILAPDPNNGGKLGPVDVGNSFSIGGGKGWQWGADGPAAGAPASSAPANPYLNSDVMTQAIMASGVPGAQDYTKRIQEQILAALSNGQL